MSVEAWAAIGAIALAFNSLIGLVTLMYARRTELNTNSMKDALVARTAESFEAKGRDEERVRGEAKAERVADQRLEENQSDEDEVAAIEKGAKEAIEPIAEEAVAKGAKDAIAEMKREDEDAEDN